jgi:hypothetical protein
MISPRTENELAAIAARLAGDPNVPDFDVMVDDRSADGADLAKMRETIRNGHDPLGVNFIRLRSPERRRAQGAVYTPRAIVEAMIEWAVGEPGPAPARVIDPGSGSGRFLLAAACAFPKARLIAAEIDPLAIAILRANAIVAGFDDRLTIHFGDYRTMDLPRIDGRTLFIGNPPYIRHHQIPDDAKEWFGETAKRLGFRASKLAGLHIHFFLRTREIARSGDFGAFITSSEWMDVNYGSVLRQMLADGLGGSALHVLNASLHPFEGTMTTGAIACFRVGNRPSTFNVRAVTSLDELKPLADGTSLEWNTVTKATRWSTLVLPGKLKPAGSVELGELFRVHRGQVTGCNAVWVAGPEAKDLPERFLFPAITKAREIFDANGTLDQFDHLRRVIDLPLDLDELTASEHKEVDRFLKWARSRKADETYIARHRRAWWKVGLYKPAPIVCTYMARRPPAFVKNRAGARHLNIAHGLYPVQPLPDEELEAILTYLRQTVTTAEGRTYAGGLVKFEPKEIERLHIPHPENILNHILAT